MVGEIRSISVSSSVTFTDVSAIMSDSAIAENGNELSEMQRVTLWWSTWFPRTPYSPETSNPKQLRTPRTLWGWMCEEKMPWLKSFTYIQDGAKAHTVTGGVRELEKAGSDPLTTPVADRICVKFLSQSAQSPDVNVNDCAFFSSLQTQIRKQGLTTPIDRSTWIWWKKSLKLLILRN